MPIDEARRHAAEHRLAAIEQRLVGLQEMGFDVASMRARLGLARHWLAAGDMITCERVSEDVLTEARHMAEHPESVGTEVRRRSDRRWRTPAPGTIVDSKPEPVTIADPPPRLAPEQPARAVAPAPVPAPAPVVDHGIAAALAEEALSKRMEERLAQCQAVSLQKLDDLAKQISSLPELLDQRSSHAIAAAVATASDTLRGEWRDDLHAVEQRVRTALTEDLGAQRSHIDASLARLGQQMTELGRAHDQLSERSTTLAAEVEAVAARSNVQEQLERMRDEMRQQIDNALIELTRKRQDATGVVAKAVSTLPTRDDLVKLGDQLRADTDWKLERLAAEQGWVTLSDVESVIRKRNPEAAPQPSSASFPRLEAALTEFVNQLSRQQERFLDSLRSSTRDAPTASTERSASKPQERAHDEQANIITEATPAADNAIDSTQSAQPDDAVSAELMNELDAVQSIPDASSASEMTVAMNLNTPVETAADTTARATPAPSQRASEVTPGSLSGSGISLMSDAVISSGALTPKGQSSSEEAVDQDIAAMARALAGTAEAPAVTTQAVAAPAPQPAPARRAASVIDDNEETRVGPSAASDAPLTAPWGAAAATAGPDSSARAIPSEAPAELRRQLADWLRQEPARSAVLAIVAHESIANPGVLAELTGLRAFVRREIREQVAAATHANSSSA